MMDHWNEYEIPSHIMRWIPWFTSLEGHEFLVEIDESYIRDNFNLCGLKIVDNYDEALDMILGPAPCEEIFLDEKFLQIYRSASDLYGLIHARFIVSTKGLALMKDKYLQGVFGQCPRIYCEKQNLLPVGFSDYLHNHRVKIYCPQCQEAYIIKSGEVNADLDGAFFGRSFPHIFLLNYTDLMPKGPPKPYVSKIFGFKVHDINSLIQIKLDNGEFGYDEVPNPEIPNSGVTN